MHPILSDKKRWAFYLLVWIELAIPITALVKYIDDTTWASAAAFALPLTMVYGFVNLSAFYVCRAVPLSEANTVKAVLTAIVNCILTAFLWLAMAYGWNALLKNLDLEWGPIALQQGTVILWVSMGLVLYALSLIGHYLVIAFEQTRNAERRELESRIQAQEAELRMLRSQIDPHFLFNSLNSISALTTSDPTGARKMTLQLAEFFRESLALAVQKKVSLAAELQFCRKFAEIEKIRFRDRLKIDIQTEGDTPRFMVPSMILQPLLENAVKHGIGQLPEGGTIRIESKRGGGWLHILVANPADPDAPPRPGNNLGLKNIRERLQALYGTDALLEVSKNNGTFNAHISLPVELES